MLTVCNAVGQVLVKPSARLLRQAALHRLAPVAVAFLLDGKLLNSVGDSFHIEVRSKEGMVERSIVSRIPRVRTTKADFGAFADKWEHFHELYTPDHVPNVHRIMRKGPLAKHRPAIGALLASTDGEVLVKRPDLSQAPYSDYEPGATSMWLLLDSKLTPEAHFMLPTGFIPTAFRACHIWGTRVMADGVTRVVRYRLERRHSAPSVGDSCSNSAACSLKSQLRQRMVEQFSGEITEYQEF